MELKRTRDGHPVKIETGEYVGQATIRVWVGNQYLGDAARQQMSERGVPAGFRGLLRCSLGAAIALTAAEWNRLEGVFAEAQAKIDATPERKQELLRAERGRLALAVQGAMDQVEADRRKWYERGPIGPPPTYSCKAVLDAQAALKAWDASHPELLQALAEETREMVDRHFWD